jgi:hypothetical protein
MTVGGRPGWLYDLLPQYHREEDAAQGEPLRRLLALVEAQADALDADMQQLLDDFFVETSRRWVVPYIGDLVGNDLLHAGDRDELSATATARWPDLVGPRPGPAPAARTRADVAKTIYYRRRKGTLPMLEELARDVTGWSAHAVEFFERLEWTQHLDHLRPHSPGAAALRAPEVAGRAHGPFDAASHTVDVRRIAPQEGWYGLRNVGLFLWRLRSHPLRRVEARNAGAPWRWRASPLGHDTPLFARWRREGDEAGLAGEIHVPGPIRPAAFFEDLRRAQGTVPASVHSDWYGHPAEYAEWSVAVTVGATRVPLERIRCARLEPWVQPAATDVALDVRRGRIALGADWVGGGPVLVDVHVGFPADVGGGPYDRSRWLVRDALAARVFTVSRDGAAADAPTLAGALALWTAAGSPNAIVRILDSRTYAENLVIAPAAGRWLAIEAADGQRPCVRPTGGALVVGPGGDRSFELTLGGLVVEGGVSITGDVGRLRLLHTTLVPGRGLTAAGAPASAEPSITAVDVLAGRPANAALRVEVAFSVCGPVRLPAHAGELLVLDSVVDGLLQAGGGWGSAIADPGGAGTEGPPLHAERSTFFGTVAVRALPLASECIFTAPLQVTRQAGCARFSFVPPGSVTPRQYRCQPRLATDAAA